VRIAVLSTSYPLREGQAAGHFVAAEVQRLCASHEVVVIAPGAHSEEQQGSPRVLRIAARGAFGPPGALERIRQQPLRAAGALEFSIRARQLLRREGRFDRVIAHWLLPCAWPIASDIGTPVEAVAHGSDVRLLAALPAALRRHITRAWLRSDSSIRCASEELRDELLACTSSALAPRLRVEAPALELPVRPPRAEARRQLGLAEHTRLIVLVARLVPEKRVAEALLAVAYLPGATVVVVGGGPLQPALSARFGQVRFTGELPRPLALTWLAAADVVVSASRREGAPSALREARALGVPVVACAAGDLPQRAAEDPGIWLI
jgi:glycosyltransferase involved in cell wall biosynthesis